MLEAQELQDDDNGAILKIRIPGTLLIIDILVLLLILSIVLIPSSALRIILGVPFLLFIPGYVLVMALFPRKAGMDAIERMALSFGISIAVVPAIGLGLNYTPWGINLEPVLYSVATFVLIVSIVAIMRQPALRERKTMTVGIPLRLPGWPESRFTRSLYFLLLISLLFTFAVFIYTITTPRPEELFTEYYILGANYEMRDYPVEFTMQENRVVRVRYDAETGEIPGEWGKIALRIVNNQGQEASYRVETIIDGDLVNVYSEGSYVEQLGPVELANGETWEQEIGIIPRHPGDNQKVDFLLYINDSNEPYQRLHLWIDVKG